MALLHRVGKSEVLSGLIVLVTDRPGRCAPLAEALQVVGTCRMLSPSVDWAALPTVCAVVTDLDLSGSQAIRCLRALQKRSWSRNPTLLCVLRGFADRDLRHAQRLGASACLPFYKDEHVIVTALLNALNPDDGALNTSVQRCADRAGSTLASLFGAAAGTGQVNLAAVEECVDPILSALSEGGLARWLNTIRAHDDATYQHSLVVAGLAAQFAAHLRFPEAQQRRLVRAALVHDVGKARVPRALLLKRGALDPAELAVMRTHPVLGHDILMSSGERDGSLLDAVRHHHEMLDGSGYPDGLRGDAIGDVVRLLSICDIYSALTERRSYREAMPSVEAMRVLHDMVGKVDQRFVDAFEEAVVGSTSKFEAAAGVSRA